MTPVREWAARSTITPHPAITSQAPWLAVSWITATAIANHLVVASQDGDYDDIPGLRVVRV
jgi:predicted nucleic acid-binding protein